MPDAAQRVVVNTTPIIALSLISKLNLLHDLYGEVMIPPAVESEVLFGELQSIGKEELQKAWWLRTVSLQDPHRADLLSDLDRGEAEVIALAQELGADLLIIDERLARRHAQRLGLTLTGTLGILLKAKERSLVTSVAPLIDQLLDGGIFLSDALIDEALRLAGEGS